MTVNGDSLSAPPTPHGGRGRGLALAVAFAAGLALPGLQSGAIAQESGCQNVFETALAITFNNSRSHFERMKPPSGDVQMDVSYGTITEKLNPCPLDGDLEYSQAGRRIDAVGDMQAVTQSGDILGIGFNGFYMTSTLSSNAATRLSADMSANGFGMIGFVRYAFGPYFKFGAEVADYEVDSPQSRIATETSKASSYFIEGGVKMDRDLVGMDITPSIEFSKTDIDGESADRHSESNILRAGVSFENVLPAYSTRFLSDVIVHQTFETQPGSSTVLESSSTLLKFGISGSTNFTETARMRLHGSLSVSEAVTGSGYSTLNASGGISYSW